MTNSYIVILKSKNIFSSNINKVYLFSSLDNAYEYAVNLEQHLKKDLINTQEIAINTNLVWKSKNTFPYWSCKIYPIDNDVIWNIYQGTEQDKYLVQYLYKNLKINDLI